MLIKNIGLLRGILPEGVLHLRGHRMDKVDSIQNAFILIKNNAIADFGSMLVCPSDDDVIDAQRGIVTPSFCDSHTHIVFAGSRHNEFVDKINGLSYEDIAQRGGGILNSVDLLHNTSEDELYKSALRRLRQVINLGTGAIEIKSGYGLSVEDELKMLRVIRRLKVAVPYVPIIPTFLGAHAVSRDFVGRQDEYVDYVTGEMLPEVSRQGVARYVDVFCDKGFFTPEQTERILAAGQLYGLRPKIHTDELSPSGGIPVALKYNALSVDHLEQVSPEHLSLLASSDTIATMLPGASFFSHLPYAPARQAISEGCIVALASDYNPGSSPSGSMPFIMTLGCIQMRLTPDQAFNAVTINGAAAMGISDKYGSVTRGKLPSLLLYPPHISAPEYIPYAYSEPQPPLLLPAIRK